MKIRKLVIVEGFQDSGKTSLLKDFVSAVLTKRNATPYLKNGTPCIYKGAAFNKRCDLTTLKCPDGDITIVINDNGRIIVVVTIGDDDDVARRVKKILENIGVDVDVLIVAVRCTIKTLRKRYERIFKVKAEIIFKPGFKHWKEFEKKEQNKWNAYFMTELLTMVQR